MCSLLGSLVWSGLELNVLQWKFSALVGWQGGLGDIQTCSFHVILEW